MHISCDQEITSATSSIKTQCEPRVIREICKSREQHSTKSQTSRNPTNFENELRLGTKLATQTVTLGQRRSREGTDNRHFPIDNSATLVATNDISFRLRYPKLLIHHETCPAQIHICLTQCPLLSQQVPHTLRPSIFSTISSSNAVCNTLGHPKSSFTARNTELFARVIA